MTEHKDSKDGRNPERIFLFDVDGEAQIEKRRFLTQRSLQAP